MSLLFSLQVLIFAFEKGLISSLLKQKIFLYFGKLSYSIYMIHVIIVFNVLWVFIIIDKLFDTKLITILHNMPYVDLGSPLYNNIMVLIILAGVIFISGFTYRFIEQKGQSLGKEIRNFFSK
jgi:peptidoglycan/LPS O-acetylase OafA/YrhL